MVPKNNIKNVHKILYLFFRFVITHFKMAYSQNIEKKINAKCNITLLQSYMKNELRYKKKIIIIAYYKT